MNGEYIKTASDTVGKEILESVIDTTANLYKSDMSAAKFQQQ